MSIAETVAPPGPIRTQVLEYSSPKVKGSVIIGVKIIGCKSIHGYSYPVPVLKEAMPLYENAPVFIEHPGDREKNRGSRQLQDYFGNLKNIRQRQDGKGIYGDLHVKESHPMAQGVLEEAAGAARFGLSHNAVVDIDKEAGEVTEIISVNSVDLVDEPATTTNLFESKEPPMADEKKETPPVETDRIEVLEGQIGEILTLLKTEPEKRGWPKAPVPRRLTVLEDVPADEQPAVVVNSPADFMAVLRGYHVTNKEGSKT